MIRSWRGIDHWPDAEVVANEVVQTVATRKLTIKQNTLLSPRCERSRQGGWEAIVESLTLFHNLCVSDRFSVRGNSSRPSRVYNEEASSLFTTVGLVFQVCLQNSSV
jgi:hypothetical protein